MKALVISDSHGATGALRNLLVLAEQQGKPDVLIYCGDGIFDVLPYRGYSLRFWAVRGNCDLSAPRDIPIERVECFSGIQVFIAHGHGYHVKRGPETLCYRAQEVRAQIACFGHSHRPLNQWVQGVLMLNPGALADGRYAILTVQNEGSIQAELLQL
ncbi:MAG: metallophosphoesterase [Clostridiales bacterium]|jgi:putative phosphoesterase|nr:metallophosphoesterase [Clostridiales bacterium]